MGCHLLRGEYVEQEYGSLVMVRNMARKRQKYTTLTVTTLQSVLHFRPLIKKTYIFGIFREKVIT